MAAAKLFAELDSEEDPNGMNALKRVDFQRAGFFFPEKDYNSVKEAQQALEFNKRRICRIMSDARSSQIESFSKANAETVRHDNAVVSMPKIRIKAGSAMSASGVK